MANKLFSHQEYQVKFFKAAVLSMAGASVFSSIFIFFAAGLLGLGPLLFIITSLLLYWFVAKTNRIRLASHLFLASLSAVILVLGILSGGVYGISIPGFFLLPPVAYFLLGQRAGTYWSIAAALSLGGVTAFENSIYASQVSNFVPEGVRKVLFGTILTLIFCTASVLAFIFERSRRQADNSVRSYSSYLQSVLQSISEALFVFSPGGTILMVNRAALQMLGFQESEIVGQNIGTILSTDKGYFDYSKVIGGATVSNERCRIKTSSGYDVSVLVTSSMLASGVRIGGGVLVARDLTAIDSLQSQLFQSQKTAAVGKLAGGIAHHLNNLLTVIVGAAEMIRLKEDTTKDSKQLAQMITDSSNRAAFLMQQVLSFSREQMLRPERLEIDKTLLGILQVRPLVCQFTLILMLRFW
jgi:PAS domain S-box-containing protein